MIPNDFFLNIGFLANFLIILLLRQYYYYQKNRKVNQIYKTNQTNKTSHTHHRMTFL